MPGRSPVPLPETLDRRPVRRVPRQGDSAVHQLLGSTQRCLAAVPATALPRLSSTATSGRSRGRRECQPHRCSTGEHPATDELAGGVLSVWTHLPGLASADRYPATVPATPSSSPPPHPAPRSTRRRHPAQLSVLTGFDSDLADEATRISNPSHGPAHRCPSRAPNAAASPTQWCWDILSRFGRLTGIRTAGQRKISAIANAARPA